MTDENAVTAPQQPVASDPGAGQTKAAVFRRRLLSAVILWAVLLGIMASGQPLAYDGLIAAFGMLGLWEFYRMLDAKRLPNFKIFGMICGALFFLSSFYFFLHRPKHSFDYEIAVVLVFMFGVFGRQLFVRTRDNSPVETMAYTLFGLLYVPWLFNFITKIIYVVPHPPGTPVVGQYYVFYLIAVAKFSDMGAYLVGSLIGRHKMIPHISPSKTWEGFGGALLFSLGISYGLRALMPVHLGLLDWRDATILGLTLSVAAVIGDLAESILKRSTGVKDSGQTLPGIGGVLDLIDSLLFTAPLLFFYLRILIGEA